MVNETVVKFARSNSWKVAWCVFCAALWTSASAMADARTDFFINNLRNSDSFRVRSSAALALGRVAPNQTVLRTLMGALGDTNPAVRIAAATSLGRLGDASALSALRRKQRDREPSVVEAVRSAIRALEDSGTPSGPSRYYVGVGTPGTAAKNVGPELLSGATGVLRGLVGAVDGVVLAPADESNAQVRRRLQQQSLSGYFIDSSVVRVDDQDGSVRVDVSLIVNTYPGRDMRAILNGSATVRGSSGERARRRAMEGAFTGALRRLPQALAAADARGGG